MSNKHHIGKSVNTIEASKEFSPYTKVVIIAGEDENGTQLVYEAGNDNGRTLEVTNPWGTQQIANDMLIRIQGYTYTPYSASGAYLPDTAELGDGVTVNGIYSVLASQDLTFDSLAVSDIEAPGADETENEFGIYADSTQKDLKRKVNTISTKFTVELGKIESEITDTESNLTTLISQTQNDILLSVKGDYAPEWSTSGTANNKYYAEDVVKVSTVADEKVTAVAFYKCTNEHTAANNKKPGSGTQWQRYWDVVSAPTVQSMIDLGLDGIVISSTESTTINNTAAITLKKGNVTITGNVTMGKVKADELTANAVNAIEISASQITSGTIAADRIGASSITIGKLDNSTRSEINNASSNASSALGAVNSWGYDNDTTYIDGGKIATGTITANQIAANTITADKLAVGAITAGTIKGATVNVEDEDGYIRGTITGAPSNFIISADSNITLQNGRYGNVDIGGGYGAIYLMPGSGSQIYVDGPIAARYGYDIDIADNLRPASGANCGTGTYHWNAVYTDDVIGWSPPSSSSDRTKKTEITYGMESLNAFFDGLNPCTFRFINGHGRRHFGMIAQDVEDLIEACGMSSMDVAALVKDPNESTGGYDYYLRYEEFIPLLIWEVQQLKRRVEGLKNERAS